MGELADDMINGACCELCGQYFVENGKSYTHSIPVVCLDCWDELSDDEKKEHQRADAKTI